MLRMESGVFYDNLPPNAFDAALDCSFANNARFGHYTSSSMSAWSTASNSSSSTSSTSPIFPHDLDFGFNVFPSPPAEQRMKLEETSPEAPKPLPSPPPASDGKRKRRRNKMNQSPDERREMLLEKNRIAAKKCRTKQMHYEARLQERFEREETRRSTLVNELASLRESMLFMKEMLVLHHGCGDQNVSHFLSAELKKAKTRWTGGASASLESTVPAALQI